MALRRTLVLAAIFSIAPTAMVMAQTEPQNDQTSSSSASSPQTETPSTSSTPDSSSTTTSSSSESSSHEQKSTHMASKQSMKECIANKQQENSGMSKADAKKACKAEMKGPG